MRRVLFLLLLCLSAADAWSQDTTGSAPAPKQPNITTVSRTRRADTIAADSLKKLPFEPNPKKAGMYSALLPGSGQIYNRQYWKAPVVYVGFGVAAYFISNNYKQYNRYRKAYIATIDKDDNTISTELYGESELKQLQDQYKQWLDMTVLLTSVGYMLQIMDAVVFAHLKNFDVTPDISMRLQPTLMPNGGAGIGLAFHF